MRLAIVGVTGLVGTEVLEVLEERKVRVDELIPVASERSAGKTVKLNDKEYTVMTVEDSLKLKPDVAIFSAGGAASLKYAPLYAEIGTIVIDNSSAWRMNPHNKLVVPEINGDVLTPEDRIIANPNCSTIQLVMVLAPLHRKYGIRRIVISTYQSVSGTGKAAVDQLMNERNGVEGEKIYPHRIDLNALPHIDVFDDEGNTKEEKKIINETRKILGDESLKITATTVRIPVMGGHSESVNIEFNRDYDLKELRSILSGTEGVVVQDDPSRNLYPMPINAHKKDDVFVGRIRRDQSQANSVNMWIVADNLRKGAATNTVQIAEYLNKHSMVI
jgi:aspartate-semialdehyde dehydrogenase